MVCTFAFTIAHVLIINVSSQTVGQYTGSQYDTLRTIMDVCMGQFKQEAPKTILFCVRDFNQEYDEEGEIRRKIVKDVNSIWLKMEKPEHLKKYEQAPERVYNLQVAVLRKYRPDNPKDFLADVAKLRYRFTDPKDGGYLLQKQNKDSNLPISDFIQLS